MNKSMIKKFYLFLSSVFIFLIHIPFVFAKTKPMNPIPVSAEFKSIVSGSTPDFSDEKPTLSNKPSVYDSLKLSAMGLSKQAYEYALKGFNYLQGVGKLNNNNIISIVDFSLPSGRKRLFILD